MAEVIRVDSIGVEFSINQHYFHAVDDVSFHIHEGETLGLVGESGSGKSVTSLAIVRLLAKSARVTGTVMYKGRNLLDMTVQEMRQIRGGEISMIFQEPMTSLNPVYKIGAQISETLHLHQRLSKREAHDQVLGMLKKVGIARPEEIMNGYPYQLSGGMRQRVMIAIAMICNPSLLIADEPTTALDVTIQAQILRLMKELSRDYGTSVLLITHDLGVVAEMCDRVAVMYAGQIVEQGTVDDIFFATHHPYTQGLLKAIPKIDVKIKERLQPIDGNVPAITRMPKGCRFSSRCPYVMERCRSEAPAFVDIGERHYSRCWLSAAEGLEK